MVRLVHWIEKASKLLLQLCGLLCLALVLLTAEQVLSRYLFDASSVALQEVEWHLFGFIFLMSAAGAMLRDEHVRVDIFYQKFSSRTRAWINITGFVLLFSPMLVALIWTGLDFALQAREFGNRGESLWSIILQGERSADPGGLPARWLIKSIIPVSGVALFLQGFAGLLRNLSILREEQA